VFENRVLRRIFGPRRDEVTGRLRKLHNEELHDLYSLSSIIRKIKLRRMRWMEPVVRMGEERNMYRILVGKPEGKRRPRHCWWITLRWIMESYNGVYWLNISGSG
jgi:hypothetical protein